MEKRRRNSFILKGHSCRGYIVLFWMDVHGEKAAEGSVPLDTGSGQTAGLSDLKYTLHHQQKLCPKVHPFSSVADVLLY